MAVDLDQVVVPNIGAMQAYAGAVVPLTQASVCEELDNLVVHIPTLLESADVDLKKRVCLKLTRTLNRRFISNAVVSRVYNVAEAAFGKPLAAMPKEFQMHALKGVDLHSVNPYQEAMVAGKRPLYLSLISVRGFSAEALIQNFPIFLLEATRDEITTAIHNMSIANPEQMGILMANLLECNLKESEGQVGLDFYRSTLLRSKLVMGYAHYFGVFAHQHPGDGGMKADKESFREYSDFLTENHKKLSQSLLPVRAVAFKAGKLEDQRYRLITILDDLASLLTPMKHIPQTAQVQSLKKELEGLTFELNHRLHQVNLELEESEASEYEEIAAPKRGHAQPDRTGEPSQKAKRRKEAV